MCIELMWQIMTRGAPSTRGAQRQDLGLLSSLKQQSSRPFRGQFLIFDIFIYAFFLMRFQPEFPWSIESLFMPSGQFLSELEQKTLKFDSAIALLSQMDLLQSCHTYGTNTITKGYENSKNIYSFLPCGQKKKRNLFHRAAPRTIHVLFVRFKYQ